MSDDVDVDVLARAAQVAHWEAYGLTPPPDLGDERDAWRAAVVSIIGATTAGDGQWLRIAFMGHIEYTGWVTEVIRNGQPAYRIELPDYLWDDDKSAWVEHSASSWFSSTPVNDRAIRRGWEERRRRIAEIAQWEARQKAKRALEAADDDESDAIEHDGIGDDPDEETDYR